MTSEWGLTTFVRHTYPVIGQAQDFVHGEFAASGWGDHPRSRNAHVVRLFDHATSSVVTVAHMHGLRDLSGKGDTPARRPQAAKLVGAHRRPAAGQRQAGGVRRFSTCCRAAKRSGRWKRWASPSSSPETAIPTRVPPTKKKKRPRRLNAGRRLNRGPPARRHGGQRDPDRAQSKNSKMLLPQADGTPVDGRP